MLLCSISILTNFAARQWLHPHLCIHICLMLEGPFCTPIKMLCRSGTAKVWCDMHLSLI